MLWALDVGWDRAGRSEVEVLVGSLRQAENPQRHRSAGSASVAGTLNTKTGKRILSAGYTAAGINHTLTVVRSFYDFHLSGGRGPLVNPVPGNVGRGFATRHRPPDEPVRPFRLGPLRQSQPELLPRAMSDPCWDEFFAALSADRDRALMLMFVTSGARAAEILGVTLRDIDWPGLRFYVISKGTRARQAVPTSPEALRALTRYLDSGPAMQPADCIWRTSRGDSRPLSYMALRRIFQRVNGRLGTNWTPHDLRHTAATRMANSGELTLVEVQQIMCHQQLRTTGRYLRTDQDALFQKVQETFARERPEPSLAAGYDEEDMKAVFG